MRTGGTFQRIAEHAVAGASRVRASADDASRAAPAQQELAASPPPAADGVIGVSAPAEPAPVLPLEERILAVDWAGRPSIEAARAMQELTTARVAAEVTTPQLALERFRTIAGKGVDDLAPDEVRTLHALMSELPDGIRIPSPDADPVRLASAAAELQRFPTGRAWFLGDGPSQIVAARALDALPDAAAARARLRDLVQLRTHSRDSILEIRTILDGLPSERIPPEVASWPERAEAVRQLGWVTQSHGGVAAGFVTHQEAGGLLFRLRNHVLGSDEGELLAQLDAILDKPLASWDASDLRELNQLMRHPDMPKPDVRLGWNLDEAMRNIVRGSGSDLVGLRAEGNSTLGLIYTDLRVARQDRLGMMGDRTHELAGRIVEGTASPAELRELRMIAERQPDLANVLPKWVRSPDRSYGSLEGELQSPHRREELRRALASSVDVGPPTLELRRLSARDVLEDDEAIRLVRLAGRLDAFGAPLPSEALPRIQRAAEQALLVSGTERSVAAITRRLATKYEWDFDPGLVLISEGRRIAALLSHAESVMPTRTNAAETVRDALLVIDDMLSPTSGVHPGLRPMLEESREVMLRHQQRLAPGSGRIANGSGILGYGKNPDYAEIGATASNVGLGAELLSEARRSAAGGAATALRRDTAAEQLPW